VSLRLGAKLTQRELAKRLSREHSFVARIEGGERRLDVVEFYWVLKALGVDAARVAAELMREFSRLEADEKAARRRGRASSRP
jgi:transcriptional regulator with XRE-family HTH domain